MSMLYKILTLLKNAGQAGVGLFLLLALPAMAQSEIPETAVEALNQLAWIAAILGAILASYLMGRIKPYIGWMNPETQSEINRLVIRFITGLTAVVAGLLVDYGMRYAVDLDTSGLWDSVRVLMITVIAPVASYLWYKKINPRPVPPPPLPVRVTEPTPTEPVSDLRGLGLPEFLVEALIDNGYPTITHIRFAPDPDLLHVPGMTPGRLKKVRELLG